MRWLTGILALAFSLTVAAESVDYQVGNVTYQGYFVSPADNAPLVLLVHDWDGLTDYEKQRADMLKAMGYAVFAADLFGQDVRPTEVKDKQQHTGELYQDRQKMRDLVQAAVTAAQQRGADTDNTVIVGYCFGGAVALEMARSGATMNGFVSFHGGLSTPAGQDYSQTRGEVLVLHGTADQMISMNDFADLAVQLEQHQVANEMISYGGADHAFTVFGGERYDAVADTRSWQRLTDFLAAKLK
jgi:dienelactone hydrolase